MDTSIADDSARVPAASVIVLNWNGAAHLPDCLAALAAQTFRDFEAIVVDNSSKDDSERIVREGFPWVKWVQTGANLGFAGGNAAGLAEARGRFVVLLNNDTRADRAWLARLVACAEANPSAGMIAAHLVDWQGSRTDSAGDGCRVTGRGYARHRGKPAELAPPSGPCFGACAGAVLYRRDLLDDVGFLDPVFFLNFEDTDLSVRACLRGWIAWFCREAVVHHRVSASQGAWSPWNVYYGARNHLWVCARNFPAGLLLKHAPLNLAEITIMAWRALRRGRGRDYARGLWHGLRGWRAQRAAGEAWRGRARLSPREFELRLHHPSVRDWWRGRRERRMKA